METFIKVLGLILLGVVLSAIVALPVMGLWNWLMPDLFELTRITYLQAWGLSVLSGLLFSQDFYKH